MGPMVIHTDRISVSLQAGPDIADITGAIESAVRAAAVERGQVSACMVGSTGSLTTIEYEAGVVEDLKDAVSRLAPAGLPYAHEAAWHDGNGHSHVQAALLGPSLVVAIRDGRLRLGTWQQVVAVNHDSKPRTREIEITVIGVGAR